MIDGHLYVEYSKANIKHSLTHIQPGVMVDNNNTFPTTTEKQRRLPGLRVLRDNTRYWGSETDINHLPPLPAESPSLTRHKFHNSRPPTPIPNRKGNNQSLLYGSKSRMSRPLSPGTPSPRLSLNLDLKPLVEGSTSLVNRFDREGLNSPDKLCESPRLRVRSLPSSPSLQRSSRFLRGPIRRFHSDSAEEHDVKDTKDEIIQRWIQDVQEKRHSLDDEPVERVETPEYLSANESSDYESGSGSILPAIRES